MQIVYQIWNGNAEVVGDAFGENHSGGQTFNGSFLDNVRTAANILAGYISDYGVDSAAGYYRSGAGPWSNSRPGKIARAARQALYDSLKKSIRSSLIVSTGMNHEELGRLFAYVDVGVKPAPTPGVEYP